MPLQPDPGQSKWRHKTVADREAASVEKLNTWLDRDDNFRHENKLDYDTLTDIRSYIQYLERINKLTEQQLSEARFREDMGR